MLEKNGPGGPFLHEKSGPGRTTFVRIGPFLTNKIGPTWTGFGGRKRSAGPILCGTIFAVTGLAESNRRQNICYNKPFDNKEGRRLSYDELHPLFFARSFISSRNKRWKPARCHS